MISKRNFSYREKLHLPNQILRFILVLLPLFLLNHAGICHNGSVAFAVPVSGITLDGNLDDWPRNFTRYPITKLEVGVPSENPDDLEAGFIIGYDAALNTIFIGVTVTDQSMVVDTGRNVNWDTHDGMELYLDQYHGQSLSEVSQFSLYGPEKMVFGFNKNWEGIEVASSISDHTRVYEWAIKLNDKKLASNSMAMDLVVIDKDEDGSYSWLAWGNNSQKLSSPNNCGDLLVIEPGTSLVEIEGKMDLSKLLSQPAPYPVRFTGQNNKGVQLQTRSDTTGAYSITIPAGTYIMDIPEELNRIDDEFYRTAPVEGTTCSITANHVNELPVLTPLQILPPDLSPDQGILHQFNPDQQSKLEEYINTYMEYYSIPGVSLAVIKEGRVVYHNTFGYMNAVTKEPVTEETLFEAASITKPVFGYVVLRLVEKGIIDLDKPLYQYLPFEALEETPDYKLMTARHVLIHQSGLPNWGVPLIRTPGTEYGYSGEGFEYLKRVVVEITGKPVEQLLDEELIEPLELYHMHFKDSEELRKVAAIGHLGGHPTYWSIPKEPGMAHSMHTEARAFSKFALALWKSQGLSADTYNNMKEIHTLSPSEYWEHENYPEGAGLGVHVRESPYGKVIGHGGNNGDFKCLFEVYQELGMGYVVFTNSSAGNELAGNLAKFLVEGNGQISTADQ